MKLLGHSVKDAVTGFAGTAHIFTEFQHGTRQYGVQPKCDADNKLPESQFFDEEQLKDLGFAMKDLGFSAMEATPPAEKTSKLGTNVVDNITGFRGVAVRRSVFLNGCVYYTVLSPSLDKDGKTVEMFIESQRLDTKTPKKAKTGGPAYRVPARG